MEMVEEGEGNLGCQGTLGVVTGMTTGVGGRRHKRAIWVCIVPIPAPIGALPVPLPLYLSQKAPLQAPGTGFSVF